MTEVDVGRPVPQAVLLNPDVADGEGMVRVPGAHALLVSPGRRPIRQPGHRRGRGGGTRGTGRATGDVQDAGLSTEEGRQLDQLLLEMVHAPGDVPRPDASVYPADRDGF